MKGSAPVLLLIVAAIVILGMVGYLFLRGTNHQSTTASDTNTTVSPAISMKDFAPNLPSNQKTTILIQLSDSSKEKYIVPTSQVDTYVKSLPQGYHVLSKSP